jgi:hypothetical protein
MSDQALINRLQTENAKYAEMLKENRKIIDNLTSMNVALDKEAASARLIIWAIAHSNGGSYDVPDSSMRMANDAKNILRSFYDKKKAATIIQAKTAVGETGRALKGAGRATPQMPCPIDGNQSAIQPGGAKSRPPSN